MTMHKWIGKVGEPTFKVEEHVLCAQPRTANPEGRPSLDGNVRNIAVTVNDEEVTCRDCLSRMYIDLVVVSDHQIGQTPNGVCVHIEPQQVGGLWLKIKNGGEVATIFLTDEQADKLANNLDLRCRRRPHHYGYES